MVYVCFMRYHNSVLFENSFVLKIVDGYKIWLDPKKICKMFTVSPDIGATSSITSDILFVL